MNRALSDDSSPTSEHPTLTNSPTGLPFGDNEATSLTQTHAPIISQPGLNQAGLDKAGENDRTVISQRPVAAPPSSCGRYR